MAEHDRWIRVRAGSGTEALLVAAMETPMQNY